MKNKLGIDTIIILIAIIVVALLLIIALTNRVEDIDGSSEEVGGLSQALKQANDIDLLKFNAKIEGYNGTQKGQFLVALYTTVNKMNEEYPDRQIKITGITEADELEDSKTYIVSLNKDKDGYYTKVNVEEKD